MNLSSELRTFLDEPRFAVVATIAPDGLPHQTVMWYLRDDDDLILSTPQGSLKHKHLQRDARVSVCIEDGFRYLTLSGTLAIVEEAPAAARARYQDIGARYMGAIQRPAAARLDSKTAELLSRERITLRLRVDHLHTNGFG